MKKDYIELIREELQLLYKAKSVLQVSYKSCKKIGIKNQYSASQLEKLEAFTSRFARASDILIQKIFRLIDELDLESQIPAATPRDRINRSEKKGIIKSAKKMVEIRKIRNRIAHEYDPRAIKNTFKAVLTYTPYLLSCIENVEGYCNAQYEIV